MKRIFLFLLLGAGCLYADFTKTGDIVQDQLSGLEWQDNDATHDDVKTWEEAVTYCEELNIAGKTDWRLPNKNELLTIVDYTKYDLAIESAFQHAAPLAYWSSTSIKEYHDYAWVVYFLDGASFGYFKIESDNTYVRCVRDMP